MSDRCDVWSDFSFNSGMRIIPVIDLMNGVVVRGVGGRRAEYRPLVSPLCPDADPVALARTFREQLGSDEIYLADLDAILGGAASVERYEAMARGGARLLIDGGVRDRQDVGRIKGLGTPVAGLETLAGPAALADLLAVASDVVFSLDLRAGAPLGNLSEWQQPTPWGIAAQAVALGVRRLLLLDLVRVGSGTGTGTEELAAALAAAYPGIEILAGGGVRGRDDLLRLRDQGIAGVLVSSALHDGRLTRADFADL